MNHFDSIAHDCSNSIPNAPELLQSCTRPSTYNHIALPWCLTRVGNWLCNNGTTFPRTIAIIVLLHAWRRHKMEIIFVLLTLCEGNPPVISGFPSQRPVTFWCFLWCASELMVQSRCRWFEMSWRSLWQWQACAAAVMVWRLLRMPVIDFSIFANVSVCADKPRCIRYFPYLFYILVWNMSCWVGVRI